MSRHKRFRPASRTAKQSAVCRLSRCSRRAGVWVNQRGLGLINLINLQFRCLGFRGIVPNSGESNGKEHRQ